MTDPRVEEIRARLAAVSPGPWEMRDDACVYHVGASFPLASEMYSWDAKFIANAPTDVTYLLTKLDEAEQERDAAYVLGMASVSRKLEAAEERERALIAGVREIEALRDRMHVSASRQALTVILSRLLPSASTRCGAVNPRTGWVCDSHTPGGIHKMRTPDGDYYSWPPGSTTGRFL